MVVRESTILKKVRKDEKTECLLWTGQKNEKGYGVYRRKVKAHRLMWEIKKGPIPKGLLVCHACDNRSCVNVDHLFLGTNVQNVLDGIEKGRMTHQNHFNIVLRQIITDPQGNEFYGHEACAKHYSTTRRKIQDMLKGRRNNRFGLSVLRIESLINKPPLSSNNEIII